MLRSHHGAGRKPHAGTESARRSQTPGGVGGRTAPSVTQSGRCLCSGYSCGDTNAVSDREVAEEGEITVRTFQGFLGSCFKEREGEKHVCPDTETRTFLGPGSPLQNRGTGVPACQSVCVGREPVCVNLRALACVGVSARACAVHACACACFCLCVCTCVGRSVLPKPRPPHKQCGKCRNDYVCSAGGLP